MFPGMILSIAFLNLKHVDMSSTRNLMVLGLAHVLGLGIPDYFKTHPDAINTGKSQLLLP